MGVHAASSQSGKEAPRGEGRRLMFDILALPANMREKIMVSVDQRETNGSVCWEWAGATNSKGYGSIGVGNRKTALTHRRAYELLAGKIPAGDTVDHLCLNMICLNTDHHELVSRAENSRRRHAAQTHCKEGHPLSGENLRLAKRSSGNTHRVCVTCQRARNREWMRASRESIEAIRTGQRVPEVKS